MSRAATSGSMKLRGLPVPDRRAEALSRVGAIVEEPKFFGHLTGRENLEVVAAARGREAFGRIDGALDRGLDPVVYISTVMVHLPTTYPVLGPHSPLAEPLSAYGAQKSTIERFVQERQRAGAPVTTLVVGGTFPTDFGANFDVDVLIPAMAEWARHGAIQDDLMSTDQVADVLLGTLASIVDIPGISLDQIVLRSPSAVAGSSQHLEADAVENIASINGTMGSRVAATSCSTVRPVNGTHRMPRTTSKLLPRSASYWMSAVPISGSSAEAIA